MCPHYGHRPVTVTVISITKKNCADRETTLLRKKEPLWHQRRERKTNGDQDGCKIALKPTPDVI
jgi:hypothetical protein